MAFGRSNSLSLNTGANNSLFSQQGTQQQNNPPSQAGSLFGAAAAAQTSQPGQTGSLFGNTQASQPQQAGGLFGNTSTQPSGGLFGNTASQPQQPQPPQQQSGSLFGNSLFNKPAQPAGASLFANTTNQSQQQAPTGGLFGASSNMAAPSQPADTSSSNNNMFSTLGQQPQQPNTNSIFGNNTTSLFGQKPPDNQHITGDMFHHAINSPRPAGNSVFGMTAISPDQLNTSLLGALQFRASQAAGPFVGKLNMGQGNAHTIAAQQAAQIGAVKVHANDLRGTTRFQDCVDEVKNHFELVDGMIQKQERFCREIQALLGKHEEDIKCIPPSVGVVREKAEGVEMVLAQDAAAVEAARKRGEVDQRDFVRCQRIAENLLLPQNYHTPGSASAYGVNSSRAVGFAGQAGEDDYDTDLIGNYFMPMAAELQKTLDAYSGNLAEIEGHMKIIEASAVGQAQQLAAKRAGVGGQSGGEDTVKELADTLRGFEQSILGVAGTVGMCREGVNELVLGRLQERVGGGGSERSRRPW